MKNLQRLVESLICGLGVMVAPAWADGTVSFQTDILPMLQTRPAFEQFLRGVFTITDDAGSGTRISDQAMPHLGGARMGPYKFSATWHGQAGDMPVILVIDTEVKFYDHTGREIKNGKLRLAVDLKETFSAIEIEPTH